MQFLFCHCLAFCSNPLLMLWVVKCVLNLFHCQHWHNHNHHSSKRVATHSWCILCSFCALYFVFCICICILQITHAVFVLCTLLFVFCICILQLTHIVFCEAGSKALPIVALGPLLLSHRVIRGVAFQRLT